MVATVAGILIFCVLGSAVLHYRTKYRERERAKAFILSRGLVPCQVPDALVRTIGGEIFGEAHHVQYAVNHPIPKVHRGHLEIMNHVIFCRFGYVEGFGPSRRKNQCGVLYWPLDTVLPELSITPERRDAPSSKDICTEWGDFNRNFRVRSGSHEFAHALLHPRMQEFLMYNASHLVVSIIPGALILVSYGWKLEAWDQLTSIAAGFEKQIPSFLIRKSN